MTATSVTGETAQADVTITATGVTLAGPRSASYQQRARFHGRLVPAAKGMRVVLFRGTTRLGSAKTRPDGSF